MTNGTGFLRATALTAAIALSAALVGCNSTQRTERDADTGATTTTNTNLFGTYSPRLGEGEAMTKMAFPTGEERTSALLLHSVAPSEVARGQDFDFSYHVTNLTSSTLQNVTLFLDSKSNLEVSSSQPTGSENDNGLVWALGDFGPKETKIITLTGSADEVGLASDCISVSYNNFLCSTIKVVEPALALTKSATERTLKCDEVTIRYTVRNTGSGAASNVTITDTLAQGLAMNNGSRNVSIPVGTLAAGESKTFEVKAMASKVGTFKSPAAATASGGLEADAAATTTVVVAPELELSSQCSDMQFLGRNMTYDYILENSGNGEAMNSVASVVIPSGTTFVRASEGGRVSGNRIVWDFGTIAAGASRNFSATVKAAAAGNYTASATANANCAESVAADCTTEIKGIPAILLEVIDITDPVEVGTNTVYVVRVTNQGSAPDTNVRVVATLPGEMSYVSSTGATTANARGQTISFAPVGNLAVGAQVEWRVTVRADDGGDVRFRLEMTSDNLTSPVIETEATNLYE